MPHTPSHRGVSSYMDPYEQQFASSRTKGLAANARRTTDAPKAKTEDEIATDIYNKVMSDPKLTSQFSGFGDNLSSLAALLGSGSESASDRLAREKFEFDKAKYLAGSGVSSSDALAKRKYEDELAKQQRSLEAYQQMLSGGSYRSGQDRMMELLRGQAGTSTRNVEDLYGEALKNIKAGYGDAQELTDAGYSALQGYLNQNPNNPYANVAVSAGPTQDDLSGLLGAYGVSADPVRAQVAAEGAAAQQGAAGFQNLLDVLGASAKQSDASRMAEMMMSQNYANTSLGSQRAGFQSQAGRAQADALAQIQQQLAQSQMEQEQSAESSRQQIENAIAAAGGKLPTKKGDEETPPAAKQKPIDALKTRMETASPSLRKKIEKFVAENPKAGKKKIEQAFPKIASKMK
jgi:hypothetical protein